MKPTGPLALTCRERGEIDLVIDRRNSVRKTVDFVSLLTYTTERLRKRHTLREVGSQSEGSSHDCPSLSTGKTATLPKKLP